MKVEKNLTRQLATTANLTNTINGGMSQAVMKVALLDTEWIVNLKVPGVDVNNIKLEVSNDLLCIYQMMHYGSGRPEMTPCLISMIPLMRNVNIDAISASFSDGYTSIVLPLDQWNDDHERQIDIVRV